jgi:low temperature requirement protein LtrA
VPVTRAAALRSDETRDRVTNVELFVDLVYVFAVTRLSTLLLEDVSVRGALETASCSRWSGRSGSTRPGR